MINRDQQNRTTYKGMLVKYKESSTYSPNKID